MAQTQSQSGPRLTFVTDPSDPTRKAQLVEDEGAEAAFNCTTLSVKDFHAKIDEFLRDLVRARLKAMGADERVEREIGRRVEVACKGVQGAIDKMVADEIERQVRARVQAYVATMPICFRLCDEKEAKDGQSEAH